MSHRETVQKLIEDKTVASILRRRSNAKEAVQALQTLLNELGFEEVLNWAKYGADGKYGGGTTKALKAFAGQAGIQSDGRRCTIELAREIIDRLKGYFGVKWAKDTAPIERRSGDFIIHEAVERGKALVYVSLAGRDQVRFTKFKKRYVCHRQPKTARF